MNPLFRPRGHSLTLRLSLSALLLAASAIGAYAQGVHEYSFPSTSGKVYSGTAVPTGRGPLDQPIPPPAAGYYGRGGGRAATPTYPSPYPFGRP
jgi:hypothetical protein